MCSPRERESERDVTRITASNLPENVSRYRYDRSAITTGIVHFGVGNFHRAHQAVYVDDLLNLGATQWGITGVSLRSASMKEALAPQDYLYNMATLGETTNYRVIGSLQDIIVAPLDSEAVIALLAKPTTQLVSSTITEKGYYLGADGLNFNHPDLQAELDILDTPKTIYGFLARGIMQRAKQAGTPAPLTIMCCDNISGGGSYLKNGVETLLRRHDKTALAWSKQNASFISSMVDRVCPSTDEALKSKVLKDTKRQDAWPVSAEPFSQWIIEKNFAGARPELDKVGAVFVDDIAPFEQMKLRYLNCAHTMISTLGYLSGYTYVHEALKAAQILKFTRRALYENVLPNAQVPDGYDAADYIESVIGRFQNGKLPYGTLQVGTDSSQKIQQRWFPTIDQAQANNADTSYFEFCLGAWVIFIKTALENGVLNDPKTQAFKKINPENTQTIFETYLAIANADKFKFYQSQTFMVAAENYVDQIQELGINESLVKFLNQ